jgi:hypothetical protein
MLCSERARLLIDYRDAVHRYSERVQDLVEMVGLEMNADTRPLRRRVREAWETAEQMRNLLQRHEANHFCDRTEFICGSSHWPG